MSVEVGEPPCPDCGADLEVLYATELGQVVTAMACSACGFVASRDGVDRVAAPEPDESEEYLLRRERTLTTADVRAALDGVPKEFRARADAHLADDEVWFLFDTADGTLVDVAWGEAVEDDADG